MHDPIWTLTPSDPQWTSITKNLWQISEPPRQLYVQGTKAALHLLEHLPERGLAIVGTRTPQARSVQLVRQVVQTLSHSRLTIVSGFARGIDTIAHTAALDAKLPTIAVLGAGLDIPYPKENELLKKRILESGSLFISEFPIGTPPRGFHFLRRNRLIAAWSQATWVVEASSRSGSLNTARWAREHNRTCFTVPCYPGDPAFEGNQTLLDRDHALAFWGVHSLGAEWLELATLTKKDKKGIRQPRTLLEKLVQQVHNQGLHQGGVSLQDLSDWATEQNWSREDFFLTFQESLDVKRVHYRDGLLITN